MTGSLPYDGAVDPRPLLFLVLGLVSCSSGPTEPSEGVPLGREFTLRPGESVTIQSTDLRVSFQGVVEDSRCPADATCVWAGDAVVALEVGTASLELRSTTAPEGVVGAYRVRLERVEPVVYRDRKIPPEAYRVVLTVTRS